MDMLLELLGWCAFAFLIFFMYINLHMENEKSKGESFPLMWEEDGFLNDFWQWLKSFK
tara:strand:+ start:645 stop:818 length:174 start_codon:yes stop_codon:yes gene_type:complete